MKTLITLPLTLTLAAVLGVTGCQQTSQRSASSRTRTGGTSQQTSQHRPVVAAPAPAPTPTPVAKPAPAPAPAPTPAPKAGCTDATGGLIHLSKTMPPEATLGGEFVAELKIVAQSCAANVVVRDMIPANASYVRSEPAATVEGNQLVWKIGDMDAGQTINAKIWFKAEKEGTIVNCASVSGDPRTCAATRVVNPAILLTKSEPKDVTVCDPIPVTLIVKNSGSSQLTGVKVSDTLPAGLTSDGKSSLVFDAGSLAPGESKEFKFNATAASAGNFVNTAQATSDQGVSAKATAATAVHQAVLALSCKAREQQFIGRPFDVCFTVANSGDTAAAGTQVMVPVPTGLTFKSATAGGQVSGNNIVWDMGSLAANTPKEVCATFTSASAGTFDFNATAKGTCAKQVSTVCATKVVGIPAVLLEAVDDPDPIQVGESTTYTIKVTNQGTADLHNMKITAVFADQTTPTSTAQGRISGKTVSFPTVATLGAKQVTTYSITVKGASVGDARNKITLTADEFTSPIEEVESTTVY